MLGGGPRSPQATLGLPDRTRACLFDLDGVLTQTAKLHAAAWKQMFDEFLRERAADRGRALRPLRRVHDYARYVDGKLRLDGARAFLASRGIELPDETVRGLAERKDEILLELLREQQVETYDGSVRYVRAAREAGLRTAVVSSSKHSGEVLASAGIARPVRRAHRRRRRRGRSTSRASRRPTPTSPPRARSASTPTQAVVFEDALAGVEAGRAGHFGYVVGVDRVGQAAELRRHGADVVVTDLAALLEAA